MIPFPLPPALAHLHEVLEGYAEHRDRGFFMAEQDRNHEAGKQPVLMYLSAAEINEITSGDRESNQRRPPTWMGEVILADQEVNPERLTRYARAGVSEFWRVRAVDAGYTIEIHNDPDRDAETYGRVATFSGSETIKSEVFVELELVPADLPA